MSKFKRSRNKKLLFMFLVSSVLIYYIVFFLRQDDGIDLGWLFATTISKESAEISCYDSSSLRNTLQELTTSSNIVKNTSIFFVETSCHEEYLKLNPRQACAIESAAKMNPNSEVYLLVPSPIARGKKFEEHVQKILTYSNVKIRYINMSNYFEGTPLEDWYRSGKLKSSRWPRSHASDILRYTTLWKYGGIYLDLDVVVMKSFNQTTNFAGAESVSDVAAGVLSFSHNHQLTEMTMSDLFWKFRGYDWGYNGPGVITRSLRKFCGTSKVEEMTRSCKDFTVFLPYAFYPVRWQDWSDYFSYNESVVSSVMAKIKDSFAVHVWNLHSRNTNVTIPSNQPYGIIASTYCPQVYSSLDGVF